MRLLTVTKDSFPVKVTLRATANPVPMCQTTRRTGLTQWQTLPKAATGGRDVLLAMLPVRDDVQRAVDAMQKSDDIEALRAGVTLISQKFTDTLRQKGVTEIDVKGREFDADLCEAVAKFAAGEEMQGKVVDIVQTG